MLDDIFVSLLFLIPTIPLPNSLIRYWSKRYLAPRKRREAEAGGGREARSSLTVWTSVKAAKEAVVSTR